MIGRARTVVGVVVAVVALAAASPASAKGDIPFRVVTPAGKVFWVRGVAARVWSQDWAHARSCMCQSPVDAARWAQRVAQQWDGNPPTPYLLEPKIGLVTLVYPSSGHAPAYGLTPDALGSATRDWNMWFFPTKQMLGILASNSTTAANRAATPSHSSTTGESRTWLWVGIAGAVAACAAMIAVPRTRRLAGRAMTAWH
jgi:hypothetical protein